MTPGRALQLLRDGNERFLSNLKANHDLLRQINETREGQWPFAAILSCMDSRTSAELIFDQGLGDIFSIRVAGNCVNEDVLGSMEYACHVVGTKLVMVLGHTRCGAVAGACDGVELGNLTALLRKLQPAIDKTTASCGSAERNSSDGEFVQEVAVNNVHHSIEEVRSRSDVLRTLESSGAIAIVGAMYDVGSGAVELLTE